MESKPHVRTGETHLEADALAIASRAAARMTRMTAKEIVITFDADSSDGLRPEAESLLSRYNEDRFHHRARGLRPPLSAYSLSVSKVWRTFDDVVESVNTSWKVARSSGRLAGAENFLRATTALYYALDEHLETCDKVIRCCFVSDKDAHKHHEQKGFRKAVASYEDHVGRVANALKHREARLIPLLLHSSFDSTLGFFAEGYHADGFVGPDRDVHRHHPAFSYSYYLRLHFFAVFLLSRNIRNTVERLLGPPDHAGKPAHSNVALRILARRVYALPSSIFPNERSLPAPDIELRDVSGRDTLRLVFPGLHTGLHPPAPRFTVQTVFRADGASQNYRLPFGTINVRPDGSYW